MGFKFNDKHSEDFKICVRTESIPYIAPKRQTVVEVFGRDGQYVFEDGYNNMLIELACSIVNEDLEERRATAYEISVWLAKTGKLIFDYEPTIEYQVVKVTNDVKGVSRGYALPVDDFNVTFECKPYREQVAYNPIADRIFYPSADETLEVPNNGTYKALPIISLTGSATTVTIGGFTFVNLDGTLYIDCKEQVVYSTSGPNKVNRIASFSGDFPELIPGVNSFLVSGTITTLRVEFIYKNTYL